MIYVHEKNINNKIAKNYKGLDAVLKSFYKKEYLIVQERLSRINFDSRKPAIFKEATEIIESYFNKIDHQMKVTGITPQSKFRSTFLEEISSYLFKDIPKINDKTFGIYNRGVYAGMKIKNHGRVDVLTKDVDVCIGKNVSITIEGSLIKDLIIPVVAVEVKTYLDATMFGEVQFSGKMIKNATPQARTYVLMEYNAVGEDKILAARQDNILNEMFVLRKNATSKIDSTVLMDYYNEISASLINIENEEKVITPGRLLTSNKY